MMDAIERIGNGAPQTETGTLAERARAGVLWITGLNVFRDVLQFSVMLILVRLLEPRIYGQFNMVSSVTGFFIVLSFRPFIEQTLQVRPNEAVDYQTHFTAGRTIQPVIFPIVN